MNTGRKLHGCSRINLASRKIQGSGSGNSSAEIDEDDGDKDEDETGEVVPWVIVAGGTDSGGQLTNSVEVLPWERPPNGLWRWRSLEGLQQPRSHFPTVGLVGGTLIVAGGQTAEAVATTSIETFDEATQSWTEEAGRALKVGRRGHASSWVDEVWCVPLVTPRQDRQDPGVVYQRPTLVVKKPRKPKFRFPMEKGDRVRTLKPAVPGVQNLIEMLGG